MTLDERIAELEKLEAEWSTMFNRLSSVGIDFHEPINVPTLSSHYIGRTNLLHQIGSKVTAKLNEAYAERARANRRQA